MVIVHAGMAPGVVTLVAADLLKKYPEVDTVEIAMTLSASAASGRSGSEFAHRLVTDQLYYLTDLIPLSQPFGVRRCLQVDLDQEGWLSQLSQGRREHLYVCFAELWLHNTLLWWAWDSGC